MALTITEYTVNIGGGSDGIYIDGNGQGSVLWTGSQFIAQAGAYGSVQTSPTGLNGSWSAPVTASAGGIYSVAYGAGIHVIATGDPSHGLRSSPTGATWTTRSTGQFLAVAFGNGIFLATGTSNAVKSSPDGITWTTLSTKSLTSSGERTLCFGNGLFMSRDATQFVTTPDGVAWTNRALVSSITGSMNNQIVWWVDRFVVLSYTNVASDYTWTLWWSTDGAVWTGVVVPGTTYDSPGCLISANNRLFIAEGTVSGSPSTGTALVEVLSLSTPAFDASTSFATNTSWAVAASSGSNLVFIAQSGSVAAKWATAADSGPPPLGPVDPFWTDFIGTREVA